MCKMAKIDDRGLINNNLQTIASMRYINIHDLISSVPVPKPNIADKLDGVQKHNKLCILDRNRVVEILDFNNNELKNMFDCVSTD